jgi:hypothetical protein
MIFVSATSLGVDYVQPLVAFQATAVGFGNPAGADGRKGN